MTKIFVNPSRCSRPRVIIVLIDTEIDGVDEDPDAILDVPGITYNDPDGTEVPSLSLRAYSRVQKSLKYYRKALPDEPGFAEGEIVLATEVVPDNPADPGSSKHTRYATKTFFYDDGTTFTLGEYARADYPEYPENDVFPPDGTGTFAELPEGFLTKRHRGIAINGTLILSLCKALPAPTLPPME